MIKDPDNDYIINYHNHDPSLRPDKASRRAGNRQDYHYMIKDPDPDNNYQLS